jgi:hypothetical protein
VEGNQDFCLMIATGEGKEQEGEALVLWLLILATG